MGTGVAMRSVGWMARDSGQESLSLSPPPPAAVGLLGLVRLDDDGAAS
jgi:hypothetical protein